MYNILLLKNNTFLQLESRLRLTSLNYYIIQGSLVVKYCRWQRVQWGSGASIFIPVEINSGNEREYMQFRSNRELALNMVQSEIRGVRLSGFVKHLTKYNSQLRKCLPAHSWSGSTIPELAIVRACASGICAAAVACVFPRLNQESRIWV